MFLDFFFKKCVGPRLVIAITIHSYHFNLHYYDRNKDNMQVERQCSILYVYYFYLHESTLKQKNIVCTLLHVDPFS